ncbi:MAG: D-alanine--D-alanine ligase [Bacteroidetes bacterium]|nr:D-alanine--D-alanine ligase [Bacteroidota bacterium]
MVYFPIYFIWLYYALKSKSFFYFTAANPKIENGGFLMESKKKIYDQLPKGTYPETLLFSAKTPFELVKAGIKNSNFTYPIIAKPDIGLRGLAIQKIDSDELLRSYISKIQVDFLIQPFVEFPNEVGIFYVRYPESENGTISGIVTKEFLIVIGDGIQTIRELLEINPRYYMQLPALQEIYGEKLNSIPSRGELINLVPYGNHARGAKFNDASIWANEKMQASINKICLQIPEFYFGRLDIKYNTLEELENGKNFSIIELNGAGSEPTHIYDPGHSLFYAWKEIARHQKILFQISAQNIKASVNCLSLSEGISMLKANSAQIKKLNAFS